MDYSKIITRGWEIVWNFKFLFLLGFLSACGGNTLSGNANFNFNFPGNFSTPSSSSPSGSTNPFGMSDAELEELGRELENVFEGGSFDPAALPGWIETAVTFFIVGICFLLILRLAFFIVRQMSEAATIKATYDIEQGLKTDFRTAFAQGRPYWAPFFGQVIILALPGFIFALLTAGFLFVSIPNIFSGPPQPTDFQQLFGTIMPLFICSFCFFVPYSILITFLKPLAQRGIVLHDKGVWESFRHGWQILRQNPLEILLMGLLYFILSIIFTIVIGLILAVVLLATMAPIFFALIAGNTLGAFQITLGVIGFIIIMILGAAFNSVGVTYRSVTFTLVYMYLTGLEGLTNLSTLPKEVG